jgi:bacillithiol synthase
LAAEKRELKQSYLAGDPDLLTLAAWPWPLHDYAPLMAARDAAPVSRSLLVEALLSQNEGLPDSQITRSQIELLSAKTTYTVTTGHQVCLLGGPMFTLYKVASTIALAQKLKAKYPQLDFVPVLWMATEDHDWEEVNHFHGSFTEKTTYPGTFQGPVGRHLLAPSIASFFPQGIPDPISSHYRPGRPMAEAFRGLMHRLFGRHGLVILDPDRPALKRTFTRQLRMELERQGMADPVRATTARMEEMGFKPQIHPREINLLYIGHGGREPLEFIAGTFRLKDGSRQWSEAGILEELQESPENFSPNVALRPVYQESILPNLAVIGGWAEVSYWLQLKGGFERMGVPFPLLVPRLHATLLTRSQAAAMAELGLPPDSISEPLHSLNDRYLQQTWDETPLKEAIHHVQKAYAGLAELVESIDPTLATGIRAEQARHSNSLESLPKKVRKSIRNRNPLPYHQILALKNAIEPENQPQQRILNFTAFDSIDPLTLVDVILDHARNMKSSHQWITLP